MTDGQSAPVATRKSLPDPGTGYRFQRPTPCGIGLSGAGDTLYKTVSRQGFDRRFQCMSTLVGAVVAKESTTVRQFAHP
jgi:hypothetical protein